MQNVNRRGVLAGLTGAFTAGKAKLSDLSVRDVGNNALMNETVGMAPFGPNAGWAKKRLKQFFTPSLLREEKRRFMVHAMDPNVHSLQSVSLVNKMRITKERQFDEHVRHSKLWYERIISGEYD